MSDITQGGEGSDKLCVRWYRNFNEITSKVFSDQMLWTANPAIAKEVSKVFEFFSKNYKIGRYHHLLVSPFTMRYKMIQMIRQEILAAKMG